MKLGIILLSFLALLFTVHGALATDSTTPSDYLVYDDAEGAIGDTWTVVNTNMAYSDYVAYSGSKSIKDQGTTAWDVSTYTAGIAGTDPFCLDFWFYVNTPVTANTQCSGFGLANGAFANEEYVIPNCYLTAPGRGMVTIGRNDGSWTKRTGNYTPNTWQYLKLCTGAGYAAAGDTYMEVYNQTSLIFNYTTLGRAGLHSLGFTSNSANNKTYYDLIRAWNRTAYGTTPPQTIANSTVTEPSWVAPTPDSGDANNVQATLNASCAAGLTTYLYWSGPEYADYVVALSNSTIGAWTTNATMNGLYQYKAACFNVTQGNWSANTTSRQWYYDVTTPTITINPSNEWNSSNATTRNAYDGSVQLNITFQDNRALYGYLINFTQGGREAWSTLNTTMSTNDTTYVRTRTADGLITPYTTFGRFNVSVTVADTHTARSIPDYQVTSSKSKITFKPGNDNNIKIETRAQSTITATKLTNRYTFTMRFDDGLTTTRVFDVKTDLCPLTYFPNSGYVAHFVSACGVRGNWIDFEGAGTLQSVVRVDDYHYVVTMNDVPATATFRSIGGLNERTNTYEVFVGNYSASTNPVVFTNTTQNFTLIVTKDQGETLSATFTYDGTTYTTTKTAGVVNDTFSATVTAKSVAGVPWSSVNGTANYAWNVTYTLPNTPSATFSVGGQQTVMTWNNTLNITILDATTGLPITQSISVTLTGVSVGFTNSTTTSEFYTRYLPPEQYTIKLSGANYSQGVYVITMNRSNAQQFTAYLQPNGSTVLMQFVDALSGVVLSDVGIIQESVVNGTWHTVTSSLSDITGKASFGYRTDGAYRFTCAKTGYATKTFTLDPVLYTSYEVRLQRDTSLDSYHDFTGVSVSYDPKLFYADRQNNLTISVLSPFGALTAYSYTLSYPGGSRSGSGTSTIGETFTAPFNVTGATWTSKVNLTITYQPNIGGQRTFSYSHGIVMAPSNTTWIANKDNTYGMGLIERMILGTIILIVAAGITTMAVGSIPGLIVGLIIGGVWVYVGFWSFWAVGISILVGVVLVAARSN